MVGLILGLLSALAATEPAWAAGLAAKAAGRNTPCPWQQLIAFPLSTSRFRTLRETIKRQLRVERTDDHFGIELIRTPTREFWIKKAGGDLDGPALLELHSRR